MDTLSDMSLNTIIPDNYYIKGAISGMFGILLSHPIDTIKTNKQTLQSINKVYSYNLRNLYKGITAPLLGVGFEKALVFGTYTHLRKDYNLSVPVSGAISGFAATMIVTPYERIKILQQSSQNKSEFIMKNMFNPKFLFKGLSATWTREIPGFAIYFSVYESLKNHFYTKNNKDISIMSSFVFGGLAGSSAWLFIYPQDRIKTIIQSTDSKSSDSKSTDLKSQDLKVKKSIKTLIQETYKTGGFRQFYVGFSWAIYRAVLLHSGTFCMMEILNSQL